jgi:hypothetical protein
MQNYIHGENDDYIPEVLQLACAEIERLRAQAATPPVALSSPAAVDALQRIWDIVHTPTKSTSHRSAERHFMADFDAIRQIIKEARAALAPEQVKNKDTSVEDTIEAIKEKHNKKNE